MQELESIDHENSLLPFVDFDGAEIQIAEARELYSAKRSAPMK